MPKASAHPAVLAALAGVFGALAAVCGKLAGSCGHLGAWQAIAGRLAMYGLLFGCNAVMLTCYVRSLRHLPSLQATIISNASNITLTGVLGYALFAEQLSVRWAAGVATVVAGLILISKATAGSSSSRGPGAAVHAEDGKELPPPFALLASSKESRCHSPLLGSVTYRMLVAYDGTAYSGWQLQPGAIPTIQSHIERALFTVLREPREVLGVCAAGRTDAGVHAKGQVVQFYTHQASLPLSKLPYRLNSLLPYDIRVVEMHKTAPDFHVTCSAIAKTYHYHVDNGAAHDPLTLRTRAHVRTPLDSSAMHAAAALMVGTHDFTQLSNDSRERLRRNPVKVMKRVDVVEVEGQGLRIEVEGNGFLYKQVRHMAGVLISVGQGRMTQEDVALLLEMGSSKAPGAGGSWRGYNVAPAKGLFLMNVQYPANVDDPNTLLYPELPHDEYGRLLSHIPGSDSEELLAGQKSTDAQDGPPTVGTDSQLLAATSSVAA